MICLFSAACIAYLVFGIVFLVKDVDVCSTHSPLWVFSICAITLNFAFSLISPMISPTPDADVVARATLDKNIVVTTGAASLKFIPVFFLELALVIAGFTILFGGYTCSDMESTGLYVWSLVALATYLLIVVVFAIVYIVCLPAYWKYCEDYAEWMSEMYPVDDSSPLMDNQHKPNNQGPSPREDVDNE